MVTRRAGKMARPTVMTEAVIDKLRQAFLIGATNDEACGYADISVKTLYNYIEKVPEFLQQIEQWKNEPILKAKTTVVKNLDDTKNAQWYLERKKKDEFAVRQEMTGADGNAIQAIIDKYGGSEGVDEVPPATEDESRPPATDA